jgi:hypothetical protein
MSFQFIHVQCIARSKPKKISTGSDTKWTVSDIAGEAMRVAENSPHVKNPSPPVIVFGIDAFQVVAEAEKRAEESKDILGRKIRMDTPIMLSGVASHPIPVSELVDPDKLAQYEFWKLETVKFLQKKYGENLLSVIEHLDEKQPHLHFYVVPEAGTGFNAKKCHDGFVAGASAGKNAPLQKDLYSTAMRSFQDDFHKQVGVKCGQARIGPRRARLSRAQWLLQKNTLATAARTFQSLQRAIKTRLAAADKVASDVIEMAKIKASSRGLKATAWLAGLVGSAPGVISKLKDRASELEAELQKAKLTAQAARIDSQRAKDSEFATAQKYTKIRQELDKRDAAAPFVSPSLSSLSNGSKFR